MALPTLRGVLKDDFGEAVVVRDMPEPCWFLCLDSYQQSLLWAWKTQNTLNNALVPFCQNGSWWWCWLSFRVLDKDVEIVRTLPIRSIIRLTHNLMRIIEINHDVSEAVTDMPIASVLPWILLYRIIRLWVGLSEHWRLNCCCSA